MDKRSVVEAIGVVGVVGSLIFVGVQVRQNAAATQSATVLQLKDSWVQLNMEKATSPELNRAEMVVRSVGWESADSASQGMYAHYVAALYHMWSNAYFQYLNGTLSEAQWGNHLREVQDAIDDPHRGQLWRLIEYAYDDPFRSLVDSLSSTR